MNIDTHGTMKCTSDWDMYEQAASSVMCSVCIEEYAGYPGYSSNGYTQYGGYAGYGYNNGMYANGYSNMGYSQSDMAGKDGGRFTFSD